MFVSEQRLLTVSFAVASARLARLPDGGWAQRVSEPVYQGGVEYLLRVGPAGALPGASRLVRVRFTEPVYREGTAAVGLRWEATGVTGGLFPALDADIRVSAVGDDGARVTLIGSYRPPLGALGADLDRLLLRAVATATIRTLLGRVAAALEGALAAEAELSAPWQPGPRTEPAPG